MKKLYVCGLSLVLIFSLLAGTAVADSAYVGTGVVRQYTSVSEYEKETGNTISEFHESPTSAALVASGDLPPVAERLPADPLVILPAQQIGPSGGIMRNGHRGNIDFWQDAIREFPLMFANDMRTVQPNILTSWESFDDNRRWVFKIREGIKWSDGVPFTADDFMFWYEADATNKTLNPGGVSALKVGDEMGVMKKIDMYTIEFSFSEPNGYILKKLCRFRPLPYLPKHYMSQFHPEYADAATHAATVEKMGFSDWTQLWESESDPARSTTSPTIWAWRTLTKESEQVHIGEQNPYFWKVDVEGNQLPYVPTVHRPNYGNQETIVLKVKAGDIDYMNPYTLGYANNYATLKQTEAQGNYTLVPQYGWCNVVGSLYFNLHHSEPALREIFTDIRFRKAVSIGIDRDTVNKVIFKGKYLPSQMAPPDGAPLFGEDPKFKQLTKYDPDGANALLDEMGLAWDSNHQWRLRSDGKPLDITLHINNNWTEHPPMAEMYKETLAELGINLILKPIGQDLYGELHAGGGYDMTMHASGFGGDALDPAPRRSEAVPMGTSWDVSTPWTLWLNVDDKELGEEPPATVKRLYEISSEYIKESDPQKLIDLELEVFQIHNDNLWVVGGLKNPITVQVYYAAIHNRLKNVSNPLSGEWYYAVPESWSIDE